MGENGTGFIKYLEGYYVHKGSANNNKTWFNYLYNFLTKQSIDVEQLSIADFERVIKVIETHLDFKQGYKKVCTRLLKWYLEWKERGTISNNNTNRLTIKHSKSVIVPFETIRHIDATTCISEGVLQDFPNANYVRYDDAVPENERVPGLIPFINHELLKGTLEEHFRNFDLHSLEYGYQDHLTIILSPLKKSKTYNRQYTSKDLEELINKYENSGDTVVPIEKLRQFMEGKSFSDIITGEYVYRDDRRIIYIYYRVLNNSDAETYLADVRKVLSHELFHAYHHIAINSRFNDSSEKAERVKEALADFFSMTYCLDTSKCIWGEKILKASHKVAKERYEEWKTREDSGWPYAYALHIMTICGMRLKFGLDLKVYKQSGCYVKFRNVFTSSNCSMSQAYADLLENNISHRAAKHSADITTVPVMNYIMQTPAALSKMTPDEIEDSFFEKNINSKESLAPLFILETLKENAGKRFGTADMHRILCESPYMLEINRNAVRRHMNTLANTYEEIYQIVDGHNLAYLYSLTPPSGFKSYYDYQNSLNN